MDAGEKGGFSRRFVIVLMSAFLAGGAVSKAEPESGKPAMKMGTGSFVFEEGGSNPGLPVEVWYHWPEGVEKSAPVVFVMHGNGRDAEQYRDEWRPFANVNGFVLLVPEFSDEHFPGAWRYHLGNVYRPNGKRKPRAEWTFTILEKLFDFVRTANGLKAARYDIYGHSAGGQFVHRLVLFHPRARIRRAVAANPGWYTMLDEGVEIPYGISNIGLSAASLRESLAARLTILLGAEDDDPRHPSLNLEDEAVAQGAHRLARGRNFYARAKAYARRKGYPYRWALEIVPDVGHSNSGMAARAMELIGTP